MKGRKPKPVMHQIAEGDPAKRGVHKLEQKLASKPKATSGLPSCPRHLKGRARYAWEFWSEQLAIMKLDKRPDAMMLEGACQLYAEAVRAELIIEKEGPIFTKKFIDSEGNVIELDKKPHPAVGIKVKSWLAVKAFCSESALTLMSRERLTLEAGGKSGSDDVELLKALSTPRNKPSGSSLIQ